MNGGGLFQGIYFMSGFFRIYYLLNQMNIIFFAFVFHFRWPDACLNFADMCLPQEKHTKTRLTNASANGKWECILHQSFVEIEF